MTDHLVPWLTNKRIGLSERLDWESDWCEPEGRVGT